MATPPSCRFAPGLGSAEHEARSCPGRGALDESSAEVEVRSWTERDSAFGSARCAGLTTARRTPGRSNISIACFRRIGRGYDRVLERRRAVALARHFREAEGSRSARSRSASAVRQRRSRRTFMTRQARRRARSRRAVGVCRGCGAYTQPRNGKGDAYAYCKACHQARSSGAGRARG